MPPRPFPSFLNSSSIQANVATGNAAKGAGKGKGKSRAESGEMAAGRDTVPGEEANGGTLPKSSSRDSLCSLESLGRRQKVDNKEMVVAAKRPIVGCLGHTFFSWMDDMVQLGYKRNKAGENLQHTDLWELPENLRAAHVVQQFEYHWAEEVAAAKAAGRKAMLETAFWKITKPWILASASFELLRMCSQYASPMVIKYIIQYIQVTSLPQVSLFTFGWSFCVFPLPSHACSGRR